MDKLIKGVGNFIFSIIVLIIIFVIIVEVASCATSHKKSDIFDMDLVTMDGHPTDYGSVKESHKIWKKAGTGKIHFGDDGKYSSNDNTIIYMTADLDNDMIKTVDVNFDKFETDPKLDMDAALKIAATYAPFDIMDKYYQFEKSWKVVNDTHDNDASIMAYKTKEEGSDYPEMLYLIVYTDNDVVKSFSYTYHLPNELNISDAVKSMNGYKNEDWKCNIYDYR